MTNLWSRSDFGGVNTAEKPAEEPDETFADLAPISEDHGDQQGDGADGDQPSDPEAEALSDAETLDRALSERLIEAIDSLKVSGAAASRVIKVANDPNASAKNLANAIELDPTLTAHIIRLANSAYYGMSGRVGNARFAVTVVGFSTVRSLATMNASGMDDTADSKPDGFWTHAAASAAASSAVSARFGVSPSDAFAAGLMHDLGIALLHNIDPTAHGDLIAKYGTDGSALNDAERRTFGIGHDEAVGRILTHWHLPTAFVHAVRSHHRAATPEDPPFLRVLRAGDLLAEAAFSTRPHLHSVELLSIGISQKDQNEIAAETRDRSAEILEGLAT